MGPSRSTFTWPKNPVSLLSQNRKSTVVGLFSQNTEFVWFAQPKQRNCFDCTAKKIENLLHLYDCLTLNKPIY